MIRLTIQHINKFGPLLFLAKQAQIFIPSHKVPAGMLTGFCQRAVDLWFEANPERQIFGDYVKDIVDDDAITEGSKVYVPTNEALGKTGLIEEEL